MIYTVFTKPWQTQSPEELAEIVAGMGYDGVELTVRDGYQVQPSDVRESLPRVARTLDAAGVQTPHVAGGGMEGVEDLFAAAGEAGVKIIRVAVGRVEGWRWHEAYEQIRRDLDVLADLSEKYGPIAGVQNHCGAFVTPNSIGLLHVCEHYDPKHVGAIWDPAHCALDGEEPEMGIDIVWKHLCAVNFKNPIYVRTNTPEAPAAEWARRWTTGRDGLASWTRVVKALKERGWDGLACCCAEYSDRSRLDELATADLAYLKGIVAEA